MALLRRRFFAALLFSFTRPGLAPVMVSLSSKVARCFLIPGCHHCPTAIFRERGSFCLPLCLDTNVTNLVTDLLKFAYINCLYNLSALALQVDPSNQPVSDSLSLNTWLQPASKQCPSLPTLSNTRPFEIPKIYPYKALRGASPN